VAAESRGHLRLHLRGRVVRHRHPESYLDAVSWHLDGESLVADSVTLEDTEIGENVHVMSDATLEGTSLETR